MKRTPLSRSQRWDILKRDDFACRYCGAYGPGIKLEVDHVVAVAAGGSNDEENLVTACFDCNRGKRAKSVLPAPPNPNVPQQQIDMVWTALVGEWPLSADKARSIRTFITAHGVEETVRAAEVTKAKRLSRDDQWRYFCGVNWRWIKAGIGESDEVIPKHPRFNHRKSSAYDRLNPPLES